ncbi:unnamed protein product [Durusdinium trenchii]|uniref:Uncharacterized protein n=1 Tax=Durusdinium trenchii TaxID=1381693 RepID=A0ABP0MCK5_9DINO
MPRRGPSFFPFLFLGVLAIFLGVHTHTHAPRAKSTGRFRARSHAAWWTEQSIQKSVRMVVDRADEKTVALKLFGQFWIDESSICGPEIQFQLDVRSAPLVTFPQNQFRW